MPDGVIRNPIPHPLNPPGTVQIIRVTGCELLVVHGPYYCLVCVTLCCIKVQWMHEHWLLVMSQGSRKGRSSHGGMRI